MAWCPTWSKNLGRYLSIMYCSICRHLHARLFYNDFGLQNSQKKKMTVKFCNLTSEIYCKIWQTLPTIGFLICCINHRFHHVLVTLMQTTLEYPFSRDSWRIHIIFWAEGEKYILSLITIRQNVYTYYVISKPRAETRIDSDAHSFYIRRNHFVIDSRI